MNSFQKAKQKARKLGIAPGEDTLRWIQRNHPRAMSETGSKVNFLPGINPIGHEIGRMGSASVHDGYQSFDSFQSAKRRARAAGCAPGTETLKWIQANEPGAISGVKI